jgi:hypothetical protein
LVARTQALGQHPAVPARILEQVRCDCDADAVILSRNSGEQRVSVRIEDWPDSGTLGPQAPHQGVETPCSDGHLIHDPAASWIRSQEAVADGAVERATSEEITAFFMELRRLHGSTNAR